MIAASYSRSGSNQEDVCDLEWHSQALVRGLRARGRPGYPPEAVDVAGLPSGPVLDLGAGAGKLTRLLVSTFVHVVAVEPDDEMRRLLVALCPEAEALPGSTKQIPLADASVDAVFAAECFHWFNNEHALAEIARVLRPRGTLVLMWNVPRGRPNRPLRPSRGC